MTLLLALASVAFAVVGVQVGIVDEAVGLGDAVDVRVLAGL